jgi:hypothetical protein
MTIASALVIMTKCLPRYQHHGAYHAVEVVDYSPSVADMLADEVIE